MSSGVFLLDKPSGKTSHTCLQRVKKLFQIRKAGHTGTLDPLATGMLPICLGEATKYSQYLLQAEKSYQVIARFGAETDTGDATGQIIRTAEVPLFEPEQIEGALKIFRGSIRQCPPMYSALKVNGKKLYEYARQGQEVERALRQVEIFSLELLRFEQHEIELYVHCSKGTYIRTLIEDLGKTLGCGAYVTNLRRLSVGQFHQEQMFSFEQIEEYLEQDGTANLNRYIMPVETLLSNWDEIKLSSCEVRRVFNGLPIVTSLALDSSQSSSLIKLCSESGRFLGLGLLDASGVVSPKRMLSVALRDSA